MQLRQSSIKVKTIANYNVYLAPWVSWLDERSKGGPVVITSQLLKIYLEMKYGSKEYSSYMRIGR